MFLPVSMDELKGSLKASVMSKILVSDGWTMALFLDYFYFMGNDLLHAIEESRIAGSVSSVLNFTFIALIPKNSSLEDFNDYRLISLCNFVYKLISKIIAT